MNVTSAPGGMAKRLNLGCGQYPKAGFVNVDNDPRSPADVHMDLDRVPYDLPGGHFELIEADHVLEHLGQPIAFMAEMDRLLAPGGRLQIRVPHFSRGFTHWDHRRGYDVSFPLYFRKDFTGGFTGIEFRLVDMTLRYFAQPYLKKQTLSGFQYAAGATLGWLFDLLANLSPYACSRLWCFWVGGFEEIEFVFEKPASQGAADTGG